MELLKTLLSGKKPGDEVYLTPNMLGMSLDEFHAVASEWVEDGGGDWFRLVSVHRESMSGRQMIDRARIEVLPPQYLFLGGFVDGQRLTVPSDHEEWYVADIKANARYRYARTNMAIGDGFQIVYIWDKLPDSDVPAAYRAATR